MNGKPSADEVEQFLADCPANVPHEFVEFHCRHGAVGVDVSIDSGYVFLWPLKDLLQLNREYALPEFAPGMLGIGSDGAGEIYAIDIRSPGSSPVGTVPAIPLQWDSFRILAPSFDSFAETLLAGTSAIPPE